MKTSEDGASEETAEYSSQEVYGLLEKKFAPRPPTVKVCKLCCPSSLETCESCLHHTPVAFKDNFKAAHPPGVMEMYIASL
jgi:hypothetical protein